MSAALPLVELHSAGKSFGGRAVLENISLSLQRGAITTLIGPNGAGKSTLVRMILGLLKADQGRCINRASTIGYMPQRLHVDQTLPLSLLRFMTLAHRNRQHCIDTLARVDLGGLAEQPLHQLSGGQLQRAMLARAIVHQPELLVLDEPVQGLDISGQAALYRLIDELVAELSCGVLMVSHDLHVVMSASHQVICLNGHICCQGMPAQIRNDPSYLGIFGAATAIYTHHHDHVHGSDEGGAHQHSQDCHHD